MLSSLHVQCAQMFSCPIALVDDLLTRASPLWMQLELFSVQTLLLCAGAQRGAGAALLLCPALSTAPGKKPLEQAKQQPWDSNYSQPQNPTTPGSLKMNLEKLSDAFSSFSFVLLGEVGGVLGLGCCWQRSPHLAGAECLGRCCSSWARGNRTQGTLLCPKGELYLCLCLCTGMEGGCGVVLKPHARVIDVLWWRLAVHPSWKPSPVL